MSFEIRAFEREDGQKFFSISQAAGILNIDQALLYLSMQDIELPTISFPGRRKLVRVIPLDWIEQFFEVIVSKQWMDMTNDQRAKILKKTAIKHKNITEEEDDNSCDARIKSLSKRIFKIM